MKLLLHMNMPSGANDGTHQVILNVSELTDIRDLPALVSHTENLLVGDHLIYDRASDGRRIWKTRGPLIINMDHVGKIAPYNENLP